MNEIFLSLGIESWKPVLSVLLLPPVPLLLLTLLGARMILWQRGVGWFVVLLSVLAMWLGACSAVGEWLQGALLSPSPALTPERVVELRRAVAKPGGVAIVVLGGGRESRAPEYGVASLSPASLERLRYGLWLSRETGAPVLFTGGLGHQAQPGATEADVAAAIAAREFVRPLRWTEPKARDTRENALFTTTMLADQGISQVVLVTHGWHMPRALRAFRDAAVYKDAKWDVVAAPMGLSARVERPVLRWMPSSEGQWLVRAVLRERLGLWFGA